jgi:hypothetical protein
MSYGYTIDEEFNLLVVKFWGRIPYSEDAAAVLEILDDPRIRHGLRILVDRTESAFGSTSTEVKTHADLVERRLDSLSPRVANVVAADLDFGMIRMFEAMMEGRVEHEFRVFRDLDEACEWLDVDPAIVTWPTEPE